MYQESYKNLNTLKLFGLVYTRLVAWTRQQGTRKAGTRIDWCDIEEPVQSGGGASSLLIVQILTNSTTETIERMSSFMSGIEPQTKIEKSSTVID